MTTLPDSTSLGQAQQWLRERINDGETCPCCTQHAQVYRWSLYSTAVRALGLFYLLGGTEHFVHSRQLKDHGHKGQGDSSRLHNWGLVEEEKSRREDGGRAGFWRVTRRGEDFLLGRITVPKYAYVYAGRVLRFDGPPINVDEALGIGFDLNILLAGDAQ